MAALVNTVKTGERGQPDADSDWSGEGLLFRNVNIIFVNLMSALIIPSVDRFFTDVRPPVSELMMFP